MVVEKVAGRAVLSFDTIIKLTSWDRNVPVVYCEERVFAGELIYRKML